MACRSPVVGSSIPVINAASLYGYQATGAAFLKTTIEQFGSAILADEMGLGKRLAVGTPVLTPVGWTPIERLQKGDHIFGRNGSLCKVIATYRDEDRPLYRITFTDGCTIDADDEHQWLVEHVRNGHRDGPRVLTTQHILDRGLADRNGNLTWRIPLVEPIDHDPDELEDPYLVGVVIGDGSQSRNSTRWVVCTDLEILNAIGARQIRTHATSKDIAYGTVNVACISGRSWEKRLPQRYLFASIVQRKALLAGLLDTDGWSNPSGTVQYCTTSNGLAEDIRALVQSLGGTATLHLKKAPRYSYRGEQRTGRPAYTLTIRLPSSFGCPFTLKRKVTRWKPLTKYQPTRIIARIDRIPDGPGVCISVDSPDQLYVTAHYIVTHNSAQALRALPLDVNCTIVCPAIVKEHWREEVKRWLDVDATILTKKNIESWEHGFGIVSWDALRTCKIKAQPFVIGDELHYSSHRTSKRSKAFSEYVRGRPNIIGLSGTPMETRPRDLWNPLDTLFPGRFGSYWQFAARYADGHKEDIPGVGSVWRDDGASNLDELRERLKPLMLRRTKNEVLELPERVRTILPIELPAKAVKALRLAACELGHDRDVGRVLGLIEHHKVDAACELAESLLAQGHRPLILTTRKVTGQQIAEKLKCPYVDGEDDSRKRRDRLLAGSGAAVATIYSVTTGINLTEFDCIIFTGLDYVPSRLLQAEARIHRIGQRRSTTIFYLIGLGTLDEVVRSTVIDRLGHFQAAIGNSPEEALLASDLGDKDEDILASIIAMAHK